jgi:hypothetical protein
MTYSTKMEIYFMPALPREIRSPSLRPFNSPLILVPAIIHICEYLKVTTLIFSASKTFLFIIPSYHTIITYHESLNIRIKIVAAVCAAISPLVSAVCNNDGNNLIRCFIDTATLATPYCSSFLSISPVTATNIITPVKLVCPRGLY